MSTSIKLSILLLGALPLLAACGGASGWSHSGWEFPRWGGTNCVDEQGFPVPCDSPHRVYHWVDPTTDATGWYGSENGPLVADADGDFFTFDAAPPHALRVGSTRAPDLQAEPDGRVYFLEHPVAMVALVRADGERPVAALLSEDGFLLDLEYEDDGLVLRNTGIPALLATSPLEPTTATGPALHTGEPLLPAGVIPGEPLVLDGLGSVGIRVEIP